MKKILTLVVVVVIALGSAGYVKGYVPSTLPYKEKVKHEKLMNSLQEMDEVTRDINSDFLTEYMTKDRAAKMRDKMYEVCEKTDQDNEDDAQGKALSGMCEALIQETVGIEQYASNNGAEDITRVFLDMLQELSVKHTDPTVDQFLRDAEDEEAIKFVEKKFKNFSNRYN